MLMIHQLSRLCAQRSRLRKDCGPDANVRREALGPRRSQERPQPLPALLSAIRDELAVGGVERRVWQDYHDFPDECTPGAVFCSAEFAAHVGSLNGFFQASGLQLGTTTIWYGG